MSESNGITTDQNQSTVIGADSYLKGELTFEKSARIDGKFDGQITGKGELQVGKNAKCKSDIEAHSVQIDGSVEGNIKAEDAVRIDSAGEIRGDITANKLVITEGAKLFGQVAIGDNSGQIQSSNPNEHNANPDTEAGRASTVGSINTSAGTRPDAAALRRGPFRR